MIIWKTWTSTKIVANKSAEKKVQKDETQPQSFMVSELVKLANNILSNLATTGSSKKTTFKLSLLVVSIVKERPVRLKHKKGKKRILKDFFI